MPASRASASGAGGRPSQLKSPTTLTDARRRRPHRERGAGDAVDLAQVRAELLVELLVAALAGEVQVELAERRQERVGVVERERRCRPGSATSSS